MCTTPTSALQTSANSVGLSDSESCLMPLCPSCIGSHNEYHLDKDIRANYLNIFDSLAEAQTAMYGVLVNLEDDKKRNVPFLSPSKMSYT